MLTGEMHVWYTGTIIRFSINLKLFKNKALVLKRKKANDFEWCSLALYDLTNNTDTAQLFTGEVNTESEELKSEPP